MNKTQKEHRKIKGYEEKKRSHYQHGELAAHRDLFTFFFSQRNKRVKFVIQKVKVFFAPFGKIFSRKVDKKCYKELKITIE